MRADVHLFSGQFVQAYRSITSFLVQSSGTWVLSIIRPSIHEIPTADNSFAFASPDAGEEGLVIPFLLQDSI
jgi:hypothetical protein